VLVAGSIGRKELAYGPLRATLQADGKILVAAGLAAVGRNTEKSPREPERRVYVLGGNPLQFRITTNGAMDIK